ncbi:MAG: glycosyltransferase family protein [Candidatus Omnitrophota bacterium]
MKQPIKKNIFAVIEARMTSSRLPGKVLKLLGDKPALELLVERLKYSKYLNGIIIAATINKTDDPIELLAKKIGVKCYRGSEDDVLLRVVEAAEKNNVDIIVEVTGDCPLIDHRIVDKTIEVYLQGEYDYVSNCVQQSYPLGMDVQVFPARKLREIEQKTSDPKDREHVSLYFYEKPGRFNIKNIESGLKESEKNIRLTLDTADDWRLLNEVVRRLYSKDPNFSLEDILELFSKSPELAQINNHVQQKSIR